MKRGIVLLLAGAIAAFAWVRVGVAAAKAGAKTAPASAAAGPAGAGAAFKHITIDAGKRRIIVSGEVCSATYALEFLLCRGRTDDYRNTKEYESLLSTKAKPSDIHAALLLLGLRPGKPSRWIPATDETPERTIPPKGPELKVEFRWKDKQNKVHQVDAASWLSHRTDAKTKPEAPRPKHWIFVGSELADDGSYYADMEGAIICVANLPGAVIDVPFASAQPLELREFLPNTKVMPPAGTAVDIIITPMPSAFKSPHARAILEIDRLGQFRVDGRRIEPVELIEWGRKFIRKYPKGQVIIRAAARSLVDDIRRARLQLRLGWIYDVEVHYLPPRDQVLPRTPAQARQSLRQWAEHLTVENTIFGDPTKDAQALLKQIDRQRDDLEAMKALWGEYAVHIRRQVSQYRASTQPAEREGPRSTSRPSDQTEKPKRPGNQGSPPADRQQELPQR